MTSIKNDNYCYFLCVILILLHFLIIIEAYEYNIAMLHRRSVCRSGPKRNIGKAFTPAECHRLCLKHMSKSGKGQCSAFTLAARLPGDCFIEYNGCDKWRKHGHYDVYQATAKDGYETKLDHAFSDCNVGSEKNLGTASSPNKCHAMCLDHVRKTRRGQCKYFTLAVRLPGACFIEYKGCSKWKPHSGYNVYKTIGEGKKSKKKEEEVSQVSVAADGRTVALQDEWRHGTYFFHPQRTPCTRGRAIGRVSVADNFCVKVSVWINSFNRAGQWKSILHVGISNGVRQPGLWVYPTRHKLHFRFGDVYDRNKGFDPGSRARVVDTRTWYLVKFCVFDGEGKLYVDGRLEAHAFNVVPWAFFQQPVFVSDPWHTPADAFIANLEIWAPFRSPF